MRPWSNCPSIRSPLAHCHLILAGSEITCAVFQAVDTTTPQVKRPYQLLRARRMDLDLSSRLGSLRGLPKARRMMRRRPRNERSAEFMFYNSPRASDLLSLRHSRKGPRGGCDESGRRGFEPLKVLSSPAVTICPRYAASGASLIATPSAWLFVTLFPASVELRLRHPARSHAAAGSRVSRPALVAESAR